MLARITERFDVLAPRKLMRFLEAIGQPISEDEPFTIFPLKWVHKTCEICIRTHEWVDALNQKHQRNVITEFMLYEPKEVACD